MLSTQTGFQNLLKEGHRHYAGLEEAILRNIEACKQISNITKTSIGPNGMKKLIVNHIDKLFVTSDAATILREIEVNHPAAKMISMAAKMQDQECGDLTNFVISFAGELLLQAESLIKMGLHPSDIVAGYEMATKSVLEYLEKYNAQSIQDPRSLEEVHPIIRSAICPKLPGYFDFFSKLVAKACIQVTPEDVDDFDAEHVRVIKILGGSLYDSEVINGMVVNRPASGTILKVEKAKVACYNCPFEIQSGETKGTILIKNANDLLNFSKSEESYLDQNIKAIADMGVKVVVVGGSISVLYFTFFN